MWPRTSRRAGRGCRRFGTTLSDSDVADVVSYLHSEKCCVEGEHLPANPWYRSETNKWTVQNGLSGGATGIVRVASGDSPEGVMVQLIAPNGVRTTVYTNEDGKYEFPKMQAGSYILRIANPLEFKPYRRDSVQIDGPTKLEDIVLERIAKTRALPATPEVEAQLSGEEILWNLPGTVEEKEALHNTCALGCHSFQQIFKNRYDERSWGVLVARMLHRGGGPLINDPLEPVSDSALATDKMLTKWLARVRGPESVDGPMYAFPRLTGESNRVVVTEFELPRALQSAHDVYGDGNGNIWYTSHLSRFFGKLDTRTGVVTEYQTPLTPGAQPGTHHVYVEKNGEVLISEPWSHKLLKLDPRNGEMVEVPVAAPFPINSAGMADFDVTPDGFVWASMGGGYAAEKIDPKTGKTGAEISDEGSLQLRRRHFAGRKFLGRRRDFRDVWKFGGASGYPHGPNAEFGFRGSQIGRAAEADSIRSAMRGSAAKTEPWWSWMPRPSASVNFIRRDLSSLTRICTPWNPTRTAKCGAENCTGESSCDSIRKRANGRNTRCRSPIRIRARFGSTSPRLRPPFGMPTTARGASFAFSRWSELLAQLSILFVSGQASSAI